MPLNPNAGEFIPAQKSIRTYLTQHLSDDIITSDSAKDSSGISLNAQENSISFLNKLRIKNLNSVIIGHLNINSVRSKIEMLSSIVEGKLDLLLVSETKIDESFPSASFEIPGFSTPYRVDKTANEGGVMLYVRSDIPSKLVSFSPLPENVQGLFIEINLFKIKWLIGGFYNPNKLYIADFLKNVSNSLDIYLNSYENLIIMGDLNSEITERAMHEFCDIFNLKSLISEKTCFKSIMNPSCIDLILTNRNKCFQNSTVVETGISDHHKLTVTVLKTVFKKKKAKSIIYRD